MKDGKKTNRIPKSTYYVQHVWNTGWPNLREQYGHGAIVVVRIRESRIVGSGWQAVTTITTVR